MVLPIVAYGDPVLKRMGVEIDEDYPGLKDLISNMWDTMYKASGVGLAAPQVGESIRLFIVDASPFADDEEYSDEDRAVFKDFKKVFINPYIVEESGDEWAFNEGCLSIPDIREDVDRKPKVTINYLDEDFVEHEETFEGIPARIIQHEYDHIDGVLFTDRISPLKKRALKKKLSNIAKGNIDVRYRMKFPLKKSKR